MAKPKIPNQKNAYKKLASRLNGYTKKVLAIYSYLAKESAKLAISAGYDGEGEFSFDDYPKTRKKANALWNYFSNNLEAIVYDGISKEWENSNELQDLLARKVIRSYTRKVGETKLKTYYEHNNAALQSFKKRQVQGLNLSKRIWSQREGVKQNLEKAIATGIEKGMSAVKLSKRVSQYLDNFPSLAKDYKRKYGKAIDISACEYRSVRLARNEINMAYRTAEQERWRHMDYIKGKEIKTTKSLRHQHDICDELAGMYPRDFQWDGWHVNCMCYAIPVVMSEEEYWSDGSKRFVNTVPEQYNKWIDNNAEKIINSKSTPTFISSNLKYLKPGDVRVNEAGKIYAELSNDSNYTNVMCNDLGGVYALHKGHHIGDESDRKFFGGKLSGFDLEKEFALGMYEKGHSVILCNECEKKGKDIVTSLDFMMDGERIDVRSITTKRDEYSSAIKAKNKQLARFNAENGTSYDSICLYFHDPNMFSENAITKGYKKFCLSRKNRPHTLRRILCVLNEPSGLVEKEFLF